MRRGVAGRNSDGFLGDLELRLPSTVTPGTWKCLGVID